MKRLSLALCALLAPVLLAAQNPASVSRAANSITPEDVRRRIAVIADDSMRGRNTPSPELEKVAEYIAGEFRRFGLKPGGENGTWFQRYGILRRQVDTAASWVRVQAAGATTTLKIGTEASLLRFGRLIPVREIQGPVVLLSGPPDSSQRLPAADVRGAWIAVLSSGAPRTPIDRMAVAAIDSGAIGILILTPWPDSVWRQRSAGALAAGYALDLPPTARDSSAAALVDLRESAAAALGIDVAAVRGQATRTARRLEGVTVALRVQQRELSRESAPNVVGILEGSDPQLKNEYVFFTGHMDHVGVTNPQEPGRCRAIGADSICNGADDDASGTIAVVEAAEAFARLQQRPRRSLVFMTVSGEERGLWGSRFYSERPTVPLASIVADINTDMIGRNWKDTVVVIGKEHSDLGATLNRVSAAHPELNMQAIDDIWPQERFYFRSDHYNFARKGVPILFFFTGTHPDYHQVGDEVAKIDAEKTSRIVKLVFYLGLDVANAAQRPVWKPESRQQIVQTQD